MKKKTYEIMEFIIQKTIYPLVIAVLGDALLIGAYFLFGFENAVVISVAIALSVLAILWSLVGFSCMIAQRFMPDEIEEAGSEAVIL